LVKRPVRNRDWRGRDIKDDGFNTPISTAIKDRSVGRFRSDTTKKAWSAKRAGGSPIEQRAKRPDRD
jgi:hypothetical protein